MCWSVERKCLKGGKRGSVGKYCWECLQGRLRQQREGCWKWSRLLHPPPPPPWHLAYLLSIGSQPPGVPLSPLPVSATCCGWDGGECGRVLGDGVCGVGMEIHLWATPKVHIVHQGSRVQLPKAPPVAPLRIWGQAVAWPLLPPSHLTLKIPFSDALLPQRLVPGGEGLAEVTPPWQPCPQGPGLPVRPSALLRPAPSVPFLGQGLQTHGTYGGGWCSGPPWSPQPDSPVPH